MYLEIAEFRLVNNVVTCLVIVKFATENVFFNSLKLAEPMTFKHICDYEITNMHCKFLITPQLTLKALMEKLFFEWSRTVGQNKSQLQSKTYSRLNTLYNYMHLYLCKCCIISMNTPRVTTLDT